VVQKKSQGWGENEDLSLLLAEGMRLLEGGDEVDEKSAEGFG
jgi:hypothetical protein